MELTKDNRQKKKKCRNCGAAIFRGEYCMRPECRAVHWNKWKCKQKKKSKNFGRCKKCGAKLKARGKYCSKKECRIAYVGKYIKKRYHGTSPKDKEFKEKIKKTSREAKRKRNGQGKTDS